MSYAWPEDTDFATWELDVLDRDCPACGRRMYIRDHRYRQLHTPDGPVELICKLNHCPDPRCPGHARTRSPELEVTIASPKWAIGWDVLCRIGHRRFSRHWSISQIRAESRDAYGIKLSDDPLSRDIRHYQVMLAARQQDPEVLRRPYEAVDEIILSIDGLQPEKGHETLYVVRELAQERVWFAEALLSATADEVRRLIHQAKRWAEALGTTVALWVSDRQDALVTGIAAEFPDVPHRSCDNHFLRDVAKPILEADSHAEVRMRKEVRGLRAVERAVLRRRRTEASQGHESPSDPEAPTPEDAGPAEDVPSAPETDPVETVVLDCCAAVRGLLNDDQGGPLDPAGLRMAEALSDVRDSIQRDVGLQKGASPSSNSAARPVASTEVSTRSGPNRERSAATLRTSGESPRPSTSGSTAIPGGERPSKD